MDTSHQLFCRLFRWNRTKDNIIKGNYISEQPMKKIRLSSLTIIIFSQCSFYSHMGIVVWIEVQLKCAFFFINRERMNPLRNKTTFTQVLLLWATWVAVWITSSWLQETCHDCSMTKGLYLYHMFFLFPLQAITKAKFEIFLKLNVVPTLWIHI